MVIKRLPNTPSRSSPSLHEGTERSRHETDILGGRRGHPQWIKQTDWTGLAIFHAPETDLPPLRRRYTAPASRSVQAEAACSATATCIDVAGREFFTCAGRLACAHQVVFVLSGRTIADAPLIDDRWTASAHRRKVRADGLHCLRPNVAL